jgi:hypothetical protein
MSPEIASIPGVQALFIGFELSGFICVLRVKLFQLDNEWRVTTDVQYACFVTFQTGRCRNEPGISGAGF